MTVKRIKPGPEADKDLKPGDSFFREIVEQAQTGIAVHKADGTITYVNQYLADLMGYSRNYIIGKSSLDFLDQEEKQAVKKLQKALNDQGRITIERCIRRKDGSALWTRVNLITKTDKRGKLTGYTAIHTDITEQKMAEEAMVNTEKTYKDLVERSGSIIMKTDSELNITYMNDYGLKFFGYTSEELLGRNVLGATIPKHDDAGRDLEAMTLDIKINTETYRTNVHQNMRKNGELVWISWTNVPRYGDDGQLIEILAIGNDISKLIKAEEALRETQMKAEMMIKYAPVGIYEIDYAGPGFLSVNDAMCKISGYSKEELLSMSPQQLLDEQGSLVFKSRIQKVLAGETPKENVEYKIRTKNGREIWATLNTKVLVDQNKSARAFVVAHDITGLKLAEEALRASEDKFSKSFRFSPNAITITRLCDGKIIEGNESVYELFGFTHEEVIGKTTMDLGIWSDPKDRKRLTKLLSVNGFIKNEEFTLLKKDRTPVIVNLSAALMKIEGQDCFLSSFIDITERKKAEEALRKSEIKLGKYNKTLEERVQKRTEEVIKQQEHLRKLNEDLLKSNKELESFAYITSHDLQEPLRMVTSYTQLLAMKYKDKLDQNANDYINFAVDGAKRMYDLINGLLQYSRISKKEAAFSDVSVNEIIDTVKANLAHLIKERNVKINTGKLPVISADHNQMIQLFQNLIANGIKFSPGIPDISISSKREKNRYIFSVRDHGIGIESFYHDKIFEIFKRLNPRDQFEGTGIGLAICKRIVENHNGEIRVESEHGKGSVFIFTIPAGKANDS